MLLMLSLKQLQMPKTRDYKKVMWLANLDFEFFNVLFLINDTS